VTFPSFHTAAGIILVISFWRTALFPIIVLYSAIMIASTPVLGGHYFVDLIAGAAVAGAVAFALGLLPSYRGLFGRRDRLYGRQAQAIRA
jgi:membrane-associated phospholipid phosphatase